MKQPPRCFKTDCEELINETKYSRMDQIKFMEGSLLKIWRSMFCLSRPYSFKCFKGCLPQILLGPFLNTLPQMFSENISDGALFKWRCSSAVCNCLEVVHKFFVWNFLQQLIYWVPVCSWYFKMVIWLFFATFTQSKKGVFSKFGF